MTNTMHDYSKYISPFSWRYGSDKMRSIWSEVNKRRIWRQIWVILAEVQSEFGIVTSEQVDDLRAHTNDIDVPRALEIEADIQHDVMAEVKAFAEKCSVGGGIIHLGMTSMDVVDNTDALRVRQSLELLLSQLENLLLSLAKQINRWSDTPVMGFTHLQPAEPSTLGYRFAQYAQDLLMDWENLSRIRDSIKGKGLKGAVGTSGSYAELIGKKNLPKFEKRLSDLLDLDFFTVTTQVYPRKQDYDVLSALAGIGASIHKLTFDLRILQSPSFGELSEPFGKNQVGSSAMPFKRNPIKAESANSLARLLAQNARVAWDNSAFTLLERTLDDSANRRTNLPEAFLIADELVRIALWIFEDLHINENGLAQNLATYGPFAATERVLMALGKAGADRQEMHEYIRVLSMDAWEALSDGKPNSLVEMISTDHRFLTFLSTDEIKSLMDASHYIGDAPERSRDFAKKILAAIDK